MKHTTLVFVRCKIYNLIKINIVYNAAYINKKIFNEICIFRKLIMPIRYLCLIDDIIEKNYFNEMFRSSYKYFILLIQINVITCSYHHVVLVTVLHL